MRELMIDVLADELSIDRRGRSTVDLTDQRWGQFIDMFCQFAGSDKCSVIELKQLLSLSQNQLIDLVHVLYLKEYHNGTGD